MRLTLKRLREDKSPQKSSWKSVLSIFQNIDCCIRLVCSSRHRIHKPSVGRPCQTVSNSWIYQDWINDKLSHINCVYDQPLPWITVWNTEQWIMWLTVGKHFLPERVWKEPFHALNPFCGNVYDRASFGWFFYSQPKERLAYVNHNLTTTHLLVFHKITSEQHHIQLWKTMKETAIQWCDLPMHIT